MEETIKQLQEFAALPDLPVALPGNRRSSTTPTSMTRKSLLPSIGNARNEASSTSSASIIASRASLNEAGEKRKILAPSKLQSTYHKDISIADMLDSSLSEALNTLYFVESSANSNGNGNHPLRTRLLSQLSNITTSEKRREDIQNVFLDVLESLSASVESDDGDIATSTEPRKRMKKLLEQYDGKIQTLQHVLSQFELGIYI